MKTVLDNLKDPRGHSYYCETMPSITLLTHFGLDQTLDAYLAEQVNRVSPLMDRTMNAALQLAIDRNQTEIFKVILRFIQRTGRSTYMDLTSITGKVRYAIDAANHPAIEAALDILPLAASKRQEILGSLLGAAIREENATTARFVAKRKDFSPSSHDLFVAMAHGMTELVEMLLERDDIDPHVLDNDRRTTLAFAAFKGLPRVVELLLSKAQVDPSIRDKFGYRALTLAVMRADEDNESSMKLIIQRLIQHGIDNNIDTGLNDKTKDGQTLLTHAVRTGRLEIFSLLLGYLRDELTGRDHNGRCLVSHAVEALWRNMDVLKALINTYSLPANTPDNDGKTPLIWAAQTAPCAEKIAALLQSGKDISINAQDSHGLTALSHAVQHTDQAAASAIAALLAHPALDPNLRDAAGRTALWHAWDITTNTTRPTTTPLHQLLAHPLTDPNAADHHGRTIAIHKAQAARPWALPAILAHPRADPNAADATARTALHTAVFDHPQTVAALLFADDDEGRPRTAIDPNPRDADGRSPLSLAVERGGVAGRTIAALLAHPDTRVDGEPDAFGMTAVEYAGREAGGPFLGEVVAPVVVRFLRETAGGDEGARRERRAAFVRKANVATRGGGVPLLALAMRYPGDREMEALVRALVGEEGIDVNWRNGKGESLFCRAVWEMDVVAMRALLGRADLEVASEEDREALRGAVEWRREHGMGLGWRRGEGEGEEGARLKEVEELLEMYLARGG
ncbi:hypothetical protein SLS55_009187 [Diplodia seriata]|uniref:Ankyrin repeat protein n=1 Tax=Diplodia seriata TaxID=420778 RepID=A0ABR3C866_9PEZI